MADILYEITGGFFDSVNQDRTYSAEQMNMPYKKIVTDGIFPDKNGGASEDFIVRPDEGMYVSVGIGNALVGGKWAELDSLTVLRVPSNTSAYSRIDSIILRADTSLNVRAVCIVYRQGTEAASPTAPALESSEYVTELRLADITVAAGASTITSANITDQRGTEECPWVAGAIPPTQAQVSEAVDQYFEENPGIFVVDSTFSDSSTNAVQNKVVKAAVDQLTDDVTELNGRLEQVKEDLNTDRNLLGYTVTESANKWNPSEQSVDKKISTASATRGELVDESGCTTSGFISAVKDDIFRWDYSRSIAEEGALLSRGTTVMIVAEYDSYGNCLLVSSTWPTLPYTVQNNDTASIRVTVATMATNSIVFGDSATTQIRYVPYDSSAELERIANIETKVSAVETKVSAVDNLIDIQTSINKWNPDMALSNKGISNATATLGKIIDTSDTTVSGFIPVTKGHTVMWYFSNSVDAPTTMAISSTAVRIAEYDKDFNCLLVTPGFPALPYAVQNSETYYVRLQVATRNWNMVIIDEDNVTTVAFVPYDPNLSIIDKIHNIVAPAPILTLPSKICSVVGLAYWCYFENMLSNGFLKDYTITTEGTLRTRREALKETRANSGVFSKSVSVYQNGNFVTSAIFRINCVTKETAETHHANVLCIGDSKTEAIGKRVRINELVANDDYLTLDFVGTNGSSPTLSEGYSGRNIVDVCTSATLNGNTNIFYDSSISGDIKFNFSLGASALSAVPDIVFIDHGANQYGIAWSTISECYEAIIASIHAYDSNIKVVICVQECTGLAKKPDYTQGNKLGYGLGNSDANYSVPKMVSAFDNRENENVFLCPQYLCVDLYRDFPLALLPVSKDSQLKEYLCLDAVHCGTNINSWNASAEYAMYAYTKRNEIPYAALKASQGVDPATDDGTYWTPIVNPEAGYNKIGEMYYATIKYILSLS